MHAHRPVIDNETYGFASQAAQEMGVPIRLMIDAAAESCSTDPFVAASAVKELAAWRDGSALDCAELRDHLEDLALRRILVVSAVNFRPEPSGPQDPIQRSGYGIPGTDTDDLASFVRGYLPIADPDEEVALVAFRRGIPRMVALASDWKPLPGTRKRYASTFFTASDGKWVNSDNKRSRRKMSDQDAAFVAACMKVVVRPTGIRNSVSWIG